MGKKHMQEFEQVKGRLGDIDRALKECANIEHYLGLDRKHGYLSQKQAEIAEFFKEGMQDVDGKLDTQQVNMESMKAFLEQRLRNLEAKIADGSRINEFMKEMEQRYVYLEDDQNRARSMLESSLQEQIRLEHSAVHSQASQIREAWEREVKARQAYQENYKELLQQERSTREAQESLIGNRLENFERGIYSELQRVWTELGKDHSPIIIQQSPPTITRQEVIAPPVYMQPQEIIKEIVSPPVQYVQPGNVTRLSSTPQSLRTSMTPGTPMTSSMRRIPSTTITPSVQAMVERFETVTLP